MYGNVWEWHAAGKEEEAVSLPKKREGSEGDGKKKRPRTGGGVFPGGNPSN